MKFSVTVTPIKPKFSPLVFTGGIMDHLDLIAELGFDAIELHIADPATLDRKALRRALDERRLGISMIGSGLAYGQEGLSWTHEDPSIRQRAIQRMKDDIDFGSEYNATLAVGLIRGDLFGDEAKMRQQRQWMLEGCQQCAHYAEGTGVTLVVEPINRYEVHYIVNMDQALDFVKDVDCPSTVGVLADTFHMNIEEPSILESIKRAGKLIRHVHLSDSNRWAPGFGHLDIPTIVATLQGAGYDHYLSLEVLPKPAPIEAATQGITYLKAILKGQ